MAPLAAACLAALLACASASPWTAGAFTALTFNEDLSYTLSLGGGAPAFVGQAPADAASAVASAVPAAAAGSPWGAASVLTLLSAAGAPLYSVAYFAAVDAFLFTRVYDAPNATRAFPWLSPAPGAPPAAALGWKQDYFFPGGPLPAAACDSRPGEVKKLSDAGLFLTLGGGATLALSAADGFTVQFPACGAPAGAAPGGFGVAALGAAAAAGAIPRGHAMAAVLLGRPGLKRATMAWGALLRQRFATARARGVATRELSYW